MCDPAVSQRQSVLRPTQGPPNAVVIGNVPHGPAVERAGMRRVSAWRALVPLGTTRPRVTALPDAHSPRHHHRAQLMMMRQLVTEGTTTDPPLKLGPCSIERTEPDNGSHYARLHTSSRFIFF